MPDLAHIFAERDWLQALSSAAEAVTLVEIVTDVKNLFAYFEGIYKQMYKAGRTNDIIGIDELCAVTLPRSHGVLGSCEHKTCPASEILAAYQRCQNVIIFNGKIRQTQNLSFESKDESRNREQFEVIKINKRGARQKRLF